MSDGGVYFVMSPCVACGRTFTYNPHLVPSVRVSRDAEGHWQPDPEGHREPFCESCIRAANVLRAEQGLPLVEVLPGAYEATDFL